MVTESIFFFWGSARKEYEEALQADDDDGTDEDDKILNLNEEDGEADLILYAINVTHFTV